ncbi:hypothetical protein T4B_11418 [Trichinella pseudospiralis]|uniref:Uncharacterized protein n=2 Tax=Trichinella pseudospiralis TaxID=6337 RepID=A0A0V1IA63_TRIPS|nr:hypothetical protein T4D_6862 [Trichinella pseudospiralis]KRZ19706.1 hypothetical protein T4B_11418 [Trichinella pseudospiralis]
MYINRKIGINFAENLSISEQTDITQHATIKGSGAGKPSHTLKQISCRLLNALEEAKGYIYSSDLKRGDDHFRKVLSVNEVDRSEGLSLTIEVLSTTCPVTSGMGLVDVYSDACLTITEEYDQIECHLKLDQLNVHIMHKK